MFRWEEQFDFQTCEVLSRGQTSDLTHWLYAVYQKRHLAEDSYSEILCGMRKKCDFLQCTIHKEKLNWVARDAVLLCGHDLCTKQVRCVVSPKIVWLGFV